VSVRTLAYWLLAYGVMQVALYAVMITGGPGWLFYFDPRLGWSAVADLLGLHGGIPSPLVGIPTLWQFAIAGALFAEAVSPKVYRIGELVMSLPTVIFFGGVIVMNMSPSHGFSIRELFYPTLVVLVFTVAPLTASFWIERA
jgi:hypothetical protein